MPEGVAPGILKGLYLLRESRMGAEKPRVQLLGSGAILREVLAAADLLEGDFGVAADLWSAPSFTELRREGLAAERWSLLHPAEPRRPSFVEACLANRKGPVLAATDYVRLYADQIRPFVSRRYVVLGTDGFGRSDRRVQLRHFFEVDRRFIALAALKALADEGVLPVAQVSAAMGKLDIDPGKPDPTRV
jgi:pyruvate dehydrogenase E1 component